jgi:hypothetical protein
MALRHHRGRPMTIQELLTVQREGGPTRCAHCDRDSTDQHHALVEAALRARIRVLEDRVASLESWLCGLS